MDKSPDTKQILCNNGDVQVDSLEVGKSSPYLGMHLHHTNSLTEIITHNINKKMYNIAKYNAWLDVNKNTPFSIKLLVLDNCVLGSILYGCEGWGDLSPIASKLELIELNLLKCALGVKKGTPTDIVYHELNRGGIVSKIMDRQHQFIKKLDGLSEEEALVKCLWNQSQQLDITTYYNTLTNENYEKDKHDRALRLVSSEKSMDKRYCELIGLKETNCIYDSYANDSCRTIITRWRLSNYELAIETGRYARPEKIERENRVCRTCLVMEDEEHTLFTCPLYNNIRTEHPNTFNNTSIRTILNPRGGFNGGELVRGHHQNFPIHRDFVMHKIIFSYSNLKC